MYPVILKESDHIGSVRRWQHAMSSTNAPLRKREIVIDFGTLK
jgi:hypothetical protein